MHVLNCRPHLRNRETPPMLRAKPAILPELCSSITPHFLEMQRIVSTFHMLGTRDDCVSFFIRCPRGQV